MEYKLMSSVQSGFILMSFSKRLKALREARHLSRAQMAEVTGVTEQQLKRYETGKNEPSTEALRKIALSLHISTDALLFDEEERAPADDLNMFFEAINEFDDQDKASAKELLQALILKANAKKWTVSA
jgi:transcriptional regulator with XRE-family HTH domain